VTKRVSSILGSIPDAVIVVARDGSIVSANRLADRVFGYESGKLVGLTIESLIPERYRKRHAGFVEGFFAEPSARPMGTGRELLALRADGSEFPAEVAIGPTEDGTSVVAVIRDVTPLVKVRDKLEEREARAQYLEETFRKTPIGVCYLDEELRYVGINEWLARINGSPVEDHLGRRVSDMLPDVAAGIGADLRHVLSTGEPVMNGLVVTETPSHPTTTRTYMHNFFPHASAAGEVIGIVCVIQDVTEAKNELEGALAEVRELKDRLQAENAYLQQEIKASHNFDDIIGSGVAMTKTLDDVEAVAKTDSTVLITGETGTGKELLAHAIHGRSNRRDRPLIKIDCTTLPSGLMESELFGHEKGAFTGAHETRAGRFELADRGTIFLDEVGELPIGLQAKLLRVLQEGEFRGLGAKRVQKTDVRVIAATNRDLQVEMREGRFRPDLYYRLCVFMIESPPLRERREDIPLLASFFVAKFSNSVGKTFESVEQSSMDALIEYDWPGNVRELQNVMERSVVLCPGGALRVRGLPGGSAGRPSADERSLRQDLQDVERSKILNALRVSGWRVKGEGNAASRLGLKPSTLQSRMKALGIARPPPSVD
jgi:formate hydrogenlyase transcriptional activator